MNRRRVVIVGGGPASLAAAYQLSVREPDAYDITIYETSWRLGGKTASGRGEHGRIEEHGMHVIFGCYHNVFDLMHDCYDRLVVECGVGADRHKFRHFFDAIEPRHFAVIGDDRFDAREYWMPWNLQFACNGAVPGDPPLPSLYALAITALQLVVHVFVGARGLRGFQSVFRWFLGYKRRLPRKKRNLPQQRRGGGDDVLGGFTGRLMFRCAELAFDDQTILGRIVRRAFEGLHKLVHHTRGLNDKPLLRRGAVGTAWTVADFTCAVVKGIITHGLVVSDRRRESDPRGKDPDSAWGSYDRIDRWDFREWLGIYGASPETQGSPLVRMIYDAAFSYENGGHLDPETGELDGERMAAGTVLRIMLLMGFTYKHAFYFKMRAGMGDVIAAPLYEVLRRRNVKFKFFNRLTGVKLGDDGQGNRVVEELQLTELARTRQGADYRPLEDEAGLLTWPAKPHEDQIEPGDYEDACNADRYLYKSAQPRPCKSLVVGHDFDVVILGIPASCIPYACPALVEEGAKAAQATSGVVVDPKSRWADVPALAATQTIALQLWFKLSLEELGWHRSPPLLSLFYDPLNTWCDMGQTLGQERWPEGDRPRSVAYFCGPLPHQTPLPTPDELRRTSRAALARLDATIRAQGDEAVAGLLDTLEQLLPNVRGPLNAATPNFNWSLLTDPQHRRGSGRLAAQYVRVNYEPSERCTLALPGQTALRIEAGATGYANLVVTGDWIKNGIHAACFEGAVQSGIRAARAVSTNPALYVIRAERLLGLDSRTPTSPAWSPVPSTRGKRKRERKAPPPELGTTV